MGDNFESDIIDKWYGGALAADGIIYCIPSNANQVLAIDPLREFLETTKANMEEDHPEKFGLLFQTRIEADEDSVPRVSLTNFNHAVIKFGQDTVFEAMDKSMQPINDLCKKSNLFPFLIAASSSGYLDFSTWLTVF